MVQRPDGRHVMVAMSWTDYAGAAEAEPELSLPLLAIEGLRQAARLIEGLRRDGRDAPAEKEDQVVDGVSKTMLSSDNHQI
jgi:hypothetical protein